jgi:hypothetical protein
MLTYAVEQDYLNNNPVKNVRTKKPGKRKAISLMMSVGHCLLPPSGPVTPKCIY